MGNRMEELSRGLRKTKKQKSGAGSQRSEAMGGWSKAVVFSQSFDDGVPVTVRRHGVHALGFAAPSWDEFGVATETDLKPQVEPFDEGPREGNGGEGTSQVVAESPNGGRVAAAPVQVAAPIAPSTNGVKPAQAPTLAAPSPDGATVGNVDESRNNFAEDIQALIEQAKGSGSPATGPMEPPPSEAPSAPESTAQSANPHAIFDRMDMSLANTFSGGTVDLTPKFRAFDEALGVEVLTTPPPGVIDAGPTPLENFEALVEPSEMDMVEDLAFITSGAEPVLGMETDPADLSGAHWRGRADAAGHNNSTSLDDLAEPFQSNVKRFSDALTRAGATVSVGSTRRDPRRTWLMHHAWRVAAGSGPPGDDPHGMGVVWDHGDADKTKAAAAAMRDAFNMRYQASLTSRHLTGNAVDWNISWSGELTINDATGKSVTIKSEPRTGQNTKLHAVGATYSVHKLVSDPPHWSDNGR